VIGFVVGSSCVAAWLLDDEQSEVADTLFQRVVDGQPIFAPPLLRYEICNVLVSAYARRKRISEEGFHNKLKLFERIPIEYDAEAGAKLTTVTADLAIKTELSVYDASYLETAMRRSIPLATFDHKLRSAAELRGVDPIWRV